MLTRQESAQRNPWSILRDCHTTHIPEDAFADSCWELVNSWLNDCIINHDCHLANSSVLPSRYLEIIDSENPTYPSVRLCENRTKMTAKFAALSHVWRASKPLMTKKDNIATMMQGISYQKLPITYQHAVKICIRLGLKFLWIDSLCIIQEDENDWQAEASKMSDIYANSYITIAAHPTEDMYGNLDSEVDNGCHLSRAPTFEISVPGTDGRQFSVFARKTHDHQQFVGMTLDEGRSSYFKRGWCFQERMLAPRILHFMESEIVFECNNELRCECGDAEYYAKSGLRTIHSHLKPRLERSFRESKDVNPSERKLELWKTYNRIVQDYSEKRLTNATDTLPALSSLASRLSPFLGNYFAGIWEFNLIHGLQWTSNWQRVDKRNECHRHKEYVAPSFSWASRQGGIALQTLDDWSDESGYDWVVISRVDCNPYGSNPLGQLTGGSITLVANRILMQYGGQLHVDAGMKWWTKLTGAEIGECQFQIDAMEDIDLAQKKEISCIEIGRARNTEEALDSDNNDSNGRYVVALVVVPSDVVQGAYQRIGLVSYHSSVRDEDLDLSEVMIV